MAKIEVREVESSAQLHNFIEYPNKLYKDDPNYVAPLTMERKEFFDKKKNPFYKFAKVKLFLAYDGKKIVGRIATCINYHHNDYHEENIGSFGFFDCPDDYQIASTLLKVAMITLKKEGVEKMRGPLNFSTNHECGFLVEGFDSPPMVMMTYNQPYLPKLAEKFGLKKVMDLLALQMSSTDPIPERMQKISDHLAKRSKITMRALNMSDFDNEIKIAMEVYNKAWEKNWGFVPMDEDEFMFTAKNLKEVVDPSLVLFAEHDGKPIGFVLALPNINTALKYLKGSLFPFGLLKYLWHTKIRN
ncbi:MAG TPA: N-acetyltransferase, partial [candidate division Zixibacteria bacterium]|nr:N-acetyltransferase [candidate division Zixibacteria bacterium]